MITTLVIIALVAIILRLIKSVTGTGPDLNPGIMTVNFAFKSVH